MNRIRVLFGNNVDFLRRFFGDSIERQSDMEVVNEIDDPVELLVSLRDVNADVILLSIDRDGSSGLPSHIFTEYPAVKLVLVDEDRGAAFIESLIPNQRPIYDVSPDGIINALRLSQ